MCGIFGVHGHPEAAALAHLGLYSLQHRGQESAGIVSVDEASGAHAHRAMGLVSDHFDARQVAALAAAYHDAIPSIMSASPAALVAADESSSHARPVA